MFISPKLKFKPVLAQKALAIRYKEPERTEVTIKKKENHKGAEPILRSLLG